MDETESGQAEKRKKKGEKKEENKKKKKKGGKEKKKRKKETEGAQTNAELGGEWQGGKWGRAGEGGRFSRATFSLMWDVKQKWGVNKGCKEKRDHLDSRLGGGKGGKKKE